MSLGWAVTVIDGVLAALGMAGILICAAATRPAVRQRGLRLGSAAMTTAGALLIVSRIARISYTDSVFGGLVMMLFGTGVSLPTLRKTNAAPPDEPRP